MSLLKRLFGGGKTEPRAPSSPPEEYKGFTIRAEPMPTGQQFRIAARVEKVVGGETRSHHLIRADVIGDREGAEEASIMKAKQAIDEQGDGIFGQR